MAGNRVPSYQRDGRQPEPQRSSDVASAVNVEIVVNVENVQNAPGTPSVSWNTRSKTRARTDRASQARAPRTIGYYISLCYLYLGTEVIITFCILTVVS